MGQSAHSQGGSSCLDWVCSLPQRRSQLMAIVTGCSSVVSICVTCPRPRAQSPALHKEKSKQTVTSSEWFYPTNCDQLDLNNEFQDGQGYISRQDPDRKHKGALFVVGERDLGFFVFVFV